MRNEFLLKIIKNNKQGQKYMKKHKQRNRWKKSCERAETAEVVEELIK